MRRAKEQGVNILKIKHMKRTEKNKKKEKMNIYG